MKMNNRTLINMNKTLSKIIWSTLLKTWATNLKNLQTGLTNPQKWKAIYRQTFLDIKPKNLHYQAPETLMIITKAP